MNTWRMCCRVHMCTEREHGWTQYNHNDACMCAAGRGHEAA
jgi:hypothetical protein